MAIVIAICALAFTMGSFWWIQLRRGHLVSYEPQTYAGYTRSDEFRLRLPLTIYNTGARTLVATDIRVVFLDSMVAVPAITFRSTLKPLTADVEDFVHPFAVGGRQAVTRFVEFGRKDWAPGEGTRQRISVGLRSGDNGAWREAVQTEITIPSGDRARVYIAHRRDPADDAPEPGAWDER